MKTLYEILAPAMLASMAAAALLTLAALVLSGVSGGIHA